MKKLICRLILAVFLTISLTGCGLIGSRKKETLMYKFNHVGFITDKPRPNEDFVAETRVWVTNPHEHPFKIEWLRFEPNSPVEGPVRTQPHIAFQVDDLTQASKNMEVLLEPFDVGFATVGFYQNSDGAVIELMEYKKNADWKPE